MFAESTDEEQIIDRVAALDIGKAELVCCVRVPASGGSKRRVQEVTTHTTMTGSLAELANRLVDLRVERVVMESTSDYWKPVFYLLEAHGLNPWLVNARDVRHLPGRPKTDLLTELPGPNSQVCVRLPIGVATFPAHEQRRGWVAGVVRVGRAAGRVARGDRGPV